MKTSEVAAFMKRFGIEQRSTMATLLGVDKTRLRRWLDGEDEDLPEYIALAFSALAWGLPAWPHSQATAMRTDVRGEPILVVRLFDVIDKLVGA